MAFITGEILDIEHIPKNRWFLFKYFRSEKQRQFVKYYLTYNTFRYMKDRTGYCFDFRWLVKLRKKLMILVEAYDKARQEADLDTLAIIESGKYETGLY